MPKPLRAGRAMQQFVERETGEPRHPQRIHGVPVLHQIAQVPERHPRDGAHGEHHQLGEQPTRVHQRLLYLALRGIAAGVPEPHQSQHHHRGTRGILGPHGETEREADRKAEPTIAGAVGNPRQQQPRGEQQTQRRIAVAVYHDALIREHRQRGGQDHHQVGRGAPLPRFAGELKQHPQRRPRGTE